MLWYSYIDIIATLAIPVNYGHANKVFVKRKQKKTTFKSFSLTFKQFFDHFLK